MGAEKGPAQRSMALKTFLSPTSSLTAYDKVGSEGIRRACCLAHLRRKFYETLQVDPGFMLVKIGEIYAVEREAKEAGLDMSGRGRLRAQRSVPLL